MATGPGKMGTLDASDMAIADSLEKEIERQLAAKRSGYTGGSVSIDVDNWTHPGQAVINELERRYKAVGWKGLSWDSNYQGKWITLRTVDATDHYNK